MKKNNCLVVALGGNALGKTPLEQKMIVQETAKAIVDIASTGKKIVVCHGNGPQVGMINLSFTIANLANPKNIAKLPLPEATSMSQGYIGFHLQNAVLNELKKRHLKQKVISLVSQVLVDKNDQAFQNPTKPIGNFYSEAEAKKLAIEHNWIVRNDANRGWRRFVASPQPVAILEKSTIIELLETNHIVIAGGGGGIPVYLDNDHYHSIPAVIDKDWTASTIARELDAEKLIILTAVDYVSINFNQPNEKNLQKVTLSEVKKLHTQKQFGVGSMEPKIAAAISFLEKYPQKEVIITSLKNALSALKKDSGTIISY